MAFPYPSPHRRPASFGYAPLEPLEPRLVLSTNYYGWVGVDTLPGYAAEYGEPDDLAGISENGRFMWSEAWVDAEDADEPYLVVDREVKYPRDLPGLEGLAVHAINSNGLALASEQTDEGTRLLVVRLASPEEREYLDERELTGDAGLDLSAATALSITDSGGILLRTEVAGSGFHALWMLRGGEVARLWEIDPAYREERIFWWLSRLGELLIDANAHDAVVGYKYVAEYDVQPMIWTPQTGAVELTALTRIGSINDDGTLVGRHGTSLVLVQNGEIIPTGLEDGPYIDHSSVIDGSRAPNGDLIVTWITGSSGYSSGGTGLDYTVGHADILDVRRRSLEYNAVFTEAGLVLNHEPGWYELVDDATAIRAIAGGLAIAWPSADGAVVDSYTPWHRGLHFQRDADSQVTWTLDTYGNGVLQEALAADAVTDLSTGRVYRVVLSHYRGLVLYNPDGLGQVFGYTPIRSNPTAFYLQDGRAIAACLAADGEMWLAFQPFPGRDDIWSAAIGPHLAQRHLENPSFASNLDSFATPWGAMNIVGLDDAGDLHVVWWSPGLRSSLWTSTNLSDVTGVPKLVGNITASATSWNGMQIFGTDERGHAIVVWWAPGPLGWRWNDLTAEAAGEPLVPGSITGAVTRWNAIELVGRTADDQVATYWWAPGREAWTYESITLQQSGATPRIVGPVSLALGPDGSQHIAGVSAAGEVIHLYWLPDGQDLWRAENLTALAVG